MMLRAVMLFITLTLAAPLPAAEPGDERKGEQAPFLIEPQLIEPQPENAPAEAAFDAEYAYLKRDFSLLTLRQIAREVDNRKPAALMSLGGSAAKGANIAPPVKLAESQHSTQAKALIYQIATKGALAAGLYGLYYYQPSVKKFVDAISGSYFLGALAAGTLSDYIRSEAFTTYHRGSGLLWGTRFAMGASSKAQCEELEQLKYAAERLPVGESKEYAGEAITFLEERFQSELASGKTPNQAAASLLEAEHALVMGLRHVLRLPVAAKDLSAHWPLRMERLTHVTKHYDDDTKAFVGRIAKHIGKLTSMGDALSGEFSKPTYLLQGPPGVGKTVLMKALAWSFNVPLISLSFKASDIAMLEGDFYADGWRSLRHLQKLSPQTRAFLDAADAQGQHSLTAFIYIDEVDKLLHDFNFGDAWRVFLGNLTNADTTSLRLNDIGRTVNIGRSIVFLAANNQTGFKEIDDRTIKHYMAKLTPEQKVKIAYSHMVSVAAEMQAADALAEQQARVMALLQAFAGNDQSSGARQIQLWADRIMLDLDDLDGIERALAILAGQGEASGSGAGTDEKPADTVEDSGLVRMLQMFAGEMAGQLGKSWAAANKPIVDELARLRQVARPDAQGLLAEPSLLNARVPAADE